ncbi:CopD family protein [Streptomyces sp. NPDC050504]|uniref:CopD family protein n=1 Tax=Streptomyces sp. NPDC050504 TaxID=3365618 RepID=UPI0037903293
MYSGPPDDGTPTSTTAGAAAQGRAARRRAARRPVTPLAAAVAGVGLLLVALLGFDAVSDGTGELAIPAAEATTLLRTVFFAALAVQAGELLLSRPARTLPGAPADLPRPWALPAALAGTAATAGQIAVLAHISDLDLTATYGTREGGLLLLTANAFAAAALCAGLRKPLPAALALAVVTVAEALRAHPEPYGPLTGSALTVVHLTAASLWTGGLLYALRAMWHWRGTPGAGLALLARYARAAGWLLAALIVTGTFSTLRRLPPDVVLSSAYGRTLLVKLLLVAVAALLALRARRRLRASRADTARAVRTELLALALVVVLSALLTVVPDPHWISTR